MNNKLNLVLLCVLILFIIVLFNNCSFNRNTEHYQKDTDIQFINNFFLADTILKVPVLVSPDKRFCIDKIVFIDAKNDLNSKYSDLYIIKECFNNDTNRYLFERIYIRSQIEVDTSHKQNCSQEYYFSSIQNGIKSIHTFQTEGVANIKFFYIIYFYTRFYVSELHNSFFSCFPLKISFYNRLSNVKFLKDEKDLETFEEMLSSSIIEYIPINSNISEIEFSRQSYFDIFEQNFNLQLSDGSQKNYAYKNKFSENKVFLMKYVQTMKEELKRDGVFFIYTIPDLRLYKVEFKSKNGTSVFPDFNSEYINDEYFMRYTDLF